MSVLGVSVTVAQENSDRPRWTAEMRLSSEHAVIGSSGDASYMFRTPR
jgi:hypothetical protein